MEGNFNAHLVANVLCHHVIWKDMKELTLAKSHFSVTLATDASLNHTTQLTMKWFILEKNHWRHSTTWSRLRHPPALEIERMSFCVFKVRFVIYVGDIYRVATTFWDTPFYDIFLGNCHKSRFQVKFTMSQCSKLVLGIFLYQKLSLLGQIF